MGAFVTGFDGKQAPPMNRWFIGGENDVRGFDMWAISPVAYMPSYATVNVYNDDGSQRYQKTLQNGVETYSPVTQNIPVYQLFQPGGDLQTVANFEYRIPLAGPVTLAAFFDAGINKIVRPDQLTITPSRLEQLNGMFPQAGFNGRVVIAPGTQRIRTSTGLELQVLLPVVNAPFRIYWAYNPTTVQTYLQPPVVADRSYFPNQATFLNAITQPGVGQGVPFYELRKTFRFTIGRTF
jgi:outer membrane protein insertion porin family